MFLCNDPLVTQLTKEGYVTLYPPRPGVLPLEVFTRNGSELMPFGPLPDIFDSSAALPVVGAAQPAPTIYRTLSSKHDFSVGLTVLGTLIKAASGSNLGLKGTYTNAREIAYSYDSVQTRSITLSSLDTFLSRSKLKADLTMAARLLEDDDICVVSDILMATAITVEATDSNGYSIELDVPVIQEMVGGNIKVSGEHNRTAKITYKGNIPLVFGLRAVRLIYDKGQFKRWKPVDTGLVARAVPGASKRVLKASAYVRFDRQLLRLKI